MVCQTPGREDGATGPQHLRRRGFCSSTTTWKSRKPTRRVTLVGRSEMCATTSAVCLGYAFRHACPTLSASIWQCRLRSCPWCARAPGPAREKMNMRLQPETQTARRSARQTANAENYTTLLASIVDSSDDAIMAKSPDGTITSWNRGAEVLYATQRKRSSASRSRF